MCGSDHRRDFLIDEAKAVGNEEYSTDSAKAKPGWSNFFCSDRLRSRGAILTFPVVSAVNVFESIYSPRRPEAAEKG